MITNKLSELSKFQVHILLLFIQSLKYSLSVSLDYSKSFDSSQLKEITAKFSVFLVNFEVTSIDRKYGVFVGINGGM